MTPFELAEPTSLRDAIALLDPDNSTVRPIAGGTALMLMMKAGVFRPTRLVSLRKLGAQYSRIAAGADGALTIGAMTPLAEVERSAEVARAAPVIPRAMRRLSNVRVRNVATIGGNLAHGDPHMDLPPVLIALGAEVAIAGPAGERTVAVEDFFAGYFETVLAKNELIAELRIPAQGKSRAAYMKVTTGSAEDWPALGVAVALVAEGAARQIRARRRQRRDREGDASQARGRGARRRHYRRRHSRARRRCGGRGGRVHLRRPRLGRLQDASCFASMWAAPCGKPSTNARSRPSPQQQRSQALMATNTMLDGGTRASAIRSDARRRGSRRARRSPAAPNTPTPCGFPACCTERSSAARSPTAASSRSILSAAKEVPGVYRVVTSEDVRKVIPEPYYGPAFHDQPILAIDKVHYVGEPVAVVLAADPHVAEEAAQLIVAEYEELPAIFDEVEAAENAILVHRGTQARRHLRRSQASQGPQGHQYRARFQAQARRRRQGLRRGRASLRAHLPHAEGPPSRARAVRVDRRLEGNRA